MIDEAISYCIEHDILRDILLKNRSEVRHMLLTEFDEKSLPSRCGKKVVNQDLRKAEMTS